MLMSESLRIADTLQGRDGRSLRRRAAAASTIQSFDTICSATQDRQDAVVTLLRATPLDLMIVIGGYNSSNTCNLARICAAECPTFHIADPDCLVSGQQIRHRPVGTKARGRPPTDWLPAAGRSRSA